MDALEQKIWKTYVTGGTGHIITKDGIVIPVVASTIQFQKGFIVAHSEIMGNVRIPKKNIRDAHPAH